MRMLEELLTDAVPHMLSDQGKQDLRAAEVFLIDNVAEYLYAQTDQEEWHVKTDFPCLAPPFPSFWMEFGRPSKVISNLCGTQTNRNLPYRVGMWFQAMEPNALARRLKSEPGATRDQLLSVIQELNRRFTPEIKQELEKLHDAGVPLTGPGSENRLSPHARAVVALLGQYQALRDLGTPDFEEKFRAQTEKKQTRWMVLCMTFIQSIRHGQIAGPVGQHVLCLSETGAVLDEQCTFNATLIKEEQWNTAGAGISTLWFSGLLAISFCHCRNVTIRDAPAAEVPAKLAKRQRERGRLPGLAYKVLEIGPMKAVLERTRSEHSTGLKRALHICRGHFALYEDKGLFGKYRGRYWIPQHLRGEIAQGAVEKAYDVRRNR